MAAARKAKKADSVMEAAIDYFSGRSHDAWRKTLLKTNPEQRGQPRMRMRGGVMVDINQPWSNLDRRAKDDNKRAARDAYAAVQRFPNDREAAANFVHEAWIKRNKADKSQPKALFKPYARLPEVEKDKDRAHVDRMKQAIAAVRKPTKKKAPAKKKAKRAAFKTVRVDARVWARLETAAKGLSKALGRNISPEALLIAGAEAIAAVAKTARK
jgi:macrodomain Ter protein organizer (MatP/YcbG family)